MKKRILSLLLTLTMLMGLLPMNVLAAEGPVEVGSAQELAQQLAANQDIVLTDDLDLSQWTTPAGEFTGTLDGNGFAVTGLTTPLLNRIGAEGLVTDLTIAGADLNGTGPVGAVAKTNAGEIRLVKLAAGSRVYSNGDARVGGLVGENTGLVAQCASQGQTAKGAGSGGAGGIVGHNNGGRVEQCANVDAVTSASQGHGSGYIGGIVGQNDNGGSVSSSYNRGTISAGAQYSSGIVGYNKGEGEDGICRDSYNAGQTEGGGNNMAVAKLGTIENCYHMDGVGQEHRGTQFVLEENADLARKLGGAFTFDEASGQIKLLWEIGEAKNPQQEMDDLKTALSGLKTLTPVYGKDKNINQVMAEAVKAMVPSGNLAVTADTISVKMTAANGLLAEDGTITYYFETPSMEAPEGAVVENVAFEITSGDMKFTHAVTVNIGWDGMKTAAALNGAAQALTFDTIKNENTDPAQVTTDLVLPATVAGSEWADVSWSSSSPAVDPSGKVTRQDQDAQVVLTARVSFRGVFVEKVLSLTVLAKPMKQVTTADELKAALKAGGAFQLGADITLPEPWSPGMLFNPFRLDGAGHTITLTGTALLDDGFFNEVGAACEVKNLVLAGTVKGNGALAQLNNGTVRNCLNLAEVISEGTNAGGFIGLNNFKVLNSVNYGTVTGAENMGSIVGRHDHDRGGAELSGCYGVGEKIAGSGNIADNNVLITEDTDLAAAAQALNANTQPGDAQWTVREGKLALLPLGESPEIPDPQQPDPEAQLEIIEIANSAELKAALADLWDDPSMSNQEGKKLVLTADFAIEDRMWFATGLNTVLDGQGHVITLNNQVLLDEIGPKGQVRNLGLNGTAEGYQFKAALATKSAGTIVNSWSRVNLKETGKLPSLKMGGLVGTLQEGGVIENCYTAGTLIADGARGGLVGRAEAGSLIKNSYWKYDIAANAAAVSEGTVENCAGKTFEDFYSQEFLDLLNANKGSNLTWNPGADGYPHFGEAGHFEPVKPVEITLTYQGGKAVTFPSSKGLVVDPWDILGETNVGVLTCPEGAHWSIDYTTHGKNIMVGAESGELFIYGGGSTVITVSDKDWNKLADFTLTVPGTIQAYDMRLTVKGGGGEDGKITVPGSTTVNLIPQVQAEEGGEWRDVNPLLFYFEADGGAMVVGNGVTATKPGTFTVTGQGLGHSASLEITSTYAPITGIRPSPSGEYVIHERHTMVFDGRPVDFLDLNLSHQAGSVLIDPPYATNQGKDAYTFSFSDPEVADYVEDFVMGIRPLKAGTTDVTVTTTKEEHNVSGTSTIILTYLNPLTSITVDEQELTVKEGTKLDLPMTFTGEKSAQGYHVTEPGMDWTYESEDGGELVISRIPNAIAVNNDKESNVANDKYYIEGVTAGTVTVTGTPWDDVNGVEPVTFTVTVAPNSDVKPVDHYQMALDDSSAAAQWIVENQKGDYGYGSEWEVFTLTRSGRPLSEAQIAAYLDSVETTYKGQTKPIDRKPTTQARVALTLTVLGQNAADFRGLDFISMLVNNPDMEVGSNEPAWTLIALDTMGYEVPQGAKWDRDSLIDEMLTYQTPNKGFGLFNNKQSNVDMTGMILQALAPYYLKGEAKVVEAVDGALDYLRDAMDDSAGYGSVESGAQVLTALTALDMDPLDKANGFAVRKSNLITGLHSYRTEEGFAFNGAVTAMSNIQALYAMESYIRFHDHETRLYDLTDLDAVKAEQRLTERLASAQQLESKQDSYTAESWAAVASAMDNARAVLADESATQEEINAADSRLAKAISELKKDDSAPVDKTIHVTFTLTGAAQSPESVRLDQNTGKVEYLTWIPAMTYELPEDATVGDLFVKALAQAGLTAKGVENNYVSTITAPADLGGYSLGEFDNGPYSGWMYQVNGKFPGVGLNAQHLEDGDLVHWRYVNDYRYEGGSGGGDFVSYEDVKLSQEDVSSGDPVELAISPVTPGDTTMVRVDMDGAENIQLRVPVKDGTFGTVIVLRDQLGNLSVVKYSAADEQSITFRMPASGEFFVLDWGKTFRDVEGHWAAPAAAYTSARGIFNGVNDGSAFLPDLEMSRGMLATVLWSLAGKPAAPVSDFKDVDRNTYYAPAIDWAAEQGIITGYGNGLFGADDTLNREQLAVILYSWLGKPAVELELDFADAEEISDWALEGMQMAVAYGFMEGVGGNRLAPGVDVTRGQAAAVLMRFCEHQAR